MAVALLPLIVTLRASAEDSPVALSYQRDIQPLLTRYCYDCHGDGAHKGNVAFDGFASDDERLAKKDVWQAALRNLRAGLMPPAKKPQPTLAEKERLEAWIKSAVFEIDPDDPDPGRLTLRRLNRTEYRNTIRDLLGVDFEVDRELPPDDAGHGFDNLADVLTLSPMVVEKYLALAKTIVSRAVPTVTRLQPEVRLSGSRFRRAGVTEEPARGGRGRGRESPTSLSYYEAGRATQTFQAPHAGRYELLLELTATEKFVDGQFDYNKCRLVFRSGGDELLRKELGREAGKSLRFELQRQWTAGEHELAFEIEPLTPDEKQVRSLAVRIDAVTVRGPEAQEHWTQPKDYQRFFIREPPADPAARREHAREVLDRFATRAFRRPAGARTVDRLAALAEQIYSQPGKTFEIGVAQAMAAVLASPRFLFREEEVEPLAPGQTHPLVDEYALASRLSYFLWSSMPDDELFRLAAEKKLRASLDAQVSRLLADPRSEALVRNFTGQWLQARDIETVPIEARAVMERETERDPEMELARQRFRELRNKDPESLTPAEKDELAKARNVFFRGRGRFQRFELSGDLRRAMRQETEQTFEHVLREDRSLLELLDSDYTFLNQRLAEHYGLPAVEGEEMRLVKLPEGSPRGGILTQGTVLAVTSNPTRTSPVKRGLFILENILGSPPAPPPPDIPALEESKKRGQDREPPLRELLALHRAEPLCSSCHDRMDPLGLALEGFNALGRFREKELGQPIDAAGMLITGEAFASIQELKRILVERHAVEFYRCIAEKLLIYALGRGLEYHDLHAVDEIVARLGRAGGKPSALIRGIIESAPFQKRRNPKPEETLREL